MLLFFILLNVISLDILVYVLAIKIKKSMPNLKQIKNLFDFNKGSDK